MQLTPENITWGRKTYYATGKIEVEYWLAHGTSERLQKFVSNGIATYSVRGNGWQHFTDLQRAINAYNDLLEL